MTICLRLGAFAFSALMVSGAAVAEETIPGPYLGISGLGAFVDDFSFNNDNGARSVKHTADFDPAFGGLVRGGYDFGVIRADLEVGYRSVSVDGVDSQGNPGGDTDLFSFMVNGTWDVDVGSDVTPYVSLGLGAIHADGDISFNDDNGRAQTKSFSETVPAGQLGLGLSYGVAKNVDLTGGYSVLAAPTDTAGEDEILLIHNVQVGLNYKF